MKKIIIRNYISIRQIIITILRYTCIHFIIIIVHIRCCIMRKNNTSTRTDKIQDCLCIRHINIFIHIRKSNDQHLLIFQYIGQAIIISILIIISIINIIYIDSLQIKLKIFHPIHICPEITAVFQCPGASVRYKLHYINSLSILRITFLLCISGFRSMNIFISVTGQLKFPGNDLKII